MTVIRILNFHCCVISFYALHLAQRLFISFDFCADFLSHKLTKHQNCHKINNFVDDRFHLPKYINPLNAAIFRGNFNRWNREEKIKHGCERKYECWCTLYNTCKKQVMKLWKDEKSKKKLINKNFCRTNFYSLPET